jgi:CRP-like cAMP-binding protein
MSDTRFQHTNLWLHGLPAQDQQEILSVARAKILSPGDILSDQGDWITEVCLVENGIISSVIPLSDGRTVEAYMVGNEGLTGAEASFLPARSVNRLTVQGPGSARCVGVEAWRAIAAARPVVRVAIADFERSLKAELAQSTACNAVHASERRFAKWLLRCHDRTEGDVMHLTQEYLGAMLGTQRTTVNDAAQSLQNRGAIKYLRGRITVTNRSELEAASCECYSAVRALRDGQWDRDTSPTPALSRPL